jgi:hypothetical protein
MQVAYTPFFRVGSIDEEWLAILTVRLVLVAQHPDSFGKFHTASDILFLEFTIAHIIGNVLLDVIPEVRVPIGFEGGVCNVEPARLQNSQLLCFSAKFFDLRCKP